MITKSEKSAQMRRVRTRNTTPEIRARKALHAAGFRFRLHDRNLPGTPDIVLPRFKTCVFVHGCFWHGHEGCAKSSLPRTRHEFWAAKIGANKQRDLRKMKELQAAGWRVEVIWECQTKSDSRLAEAIKRLGLRR